MAIFEASFWKFVWPFLLFGSGGAGIKLYFRDDGVLDGELLATANTNPSTPSQQNSNKAIQPPASGQVTTKPTPPQPAKTPPVASTTQEDKSYGGKLKTLGFTTVSSSTSDDVLKNILIQRMYPQYMSKVSYGNNRMFTGFKKTEIDGKKYTNNSGKTLYVLKKPEKADTDNLKTACETALKMENKIPNQLQSLKEWCTEPKVKAIIERHKLKTLNTEENNTDNESNWKEIIAGGWFSKEYKDKQTFITGSELTTFLGSKEGITKEDEVTQDHIKTLKAKCKDALAKNYERKTFPATKQFIDDLKDQDDKNYFGSQLDPFQEAVFFCTEPETAGNYVKNAIQGVPVSSIEAKFNKDYCKIDGKSVSDYVSVNTYDPLEGKSFWCAVRLIYGPKPKSA